MIQRGRKSAAALNAIAQQDRPDAPKHLSREEADEWRRVVERMPAGWFPAETHGLLECYCAHVTMARFIQAQIRSDRSLENIARWAKAHEAETAAVARLATKLRITPNSRYDRRQAGIACRTEPRGPKPWEIGLDEDHPELEDVLVRRDS
jgi:phage terminase small subunit